MKNRNKQKNSSWYGCKKKRILFSFVIICSFLFAGISGNRLVPNQSVTVQAATLGQENALAKAKTYLATMPFSKKGLVQQLQYEGFTKKEANYGVKHCKADWKEQAAKKAEQYLEVMSFSKKGLIEQLKYDGFTKAQAKYGVKAAGY
jgi:hypothetical protein